MPPALELAGMTFGQLTVLKRSHRQQGQSWKWRCRCTCGRVVLVQGSILKAGLTRSCASCAATASSTTHGMSASPLYFRWRAMIARTSNPRHRGYSNYGGRGIKVCDHWGAFENFAVDMGPTFSPELELDRIDVDGHYEPANCRWADRSTQQRNRRNNHVVTMWGRALTVQDWGELLGLKPNSIITRLRRGWPVERALTKDADPSVLLEIANSEDMGGVA